MEKMLDKKSRDFAKNMRDKMIYDKSKNEVQIGTNLYVDGTITQNGEMPIISKNFGNLPNGTLTIQNYEKDICYYIYGRNAGQPQLTINTGKKIISFDNSIPLSNISAETSIYGENSNLIQFTNEYDWNTFIYVTAHVVFIMCDNEK